MLEIKAVDDRDFVGNMSNLDLQARKIHSLII